jgi:hypothetical protein
MADDMPGNVVSQVLFLCIAPALGLFTARIDASLCTIRLVMNVYNDRSEQCATRNNESSLIAH